MPRPPHPTPGALRRILVAIRPRDDAPTVAGYAAELASSLAAELILVGIAPVVAVRMTSTTTFAFDPLEVDTQRAEQAIVDRAMRGSLDELAPALPAGLSHRAVVTWEPPGPATVAAARECAADLVVIAMRARTTELGHALHDHADRHVLHHCDVPVLVVPTSS